MLLDTNPLTFLFTFLSVIGAITIHECAHAWMADRLGDPTPRLQGRVTLNPLAHLDLLGTIAMLLTHFGWGKPVMFDPYNLANPRRDAALIAVAGPASNLLLATALSLILRLIPLGPATGLLIIFLATFTAINVFLAVFNFIPVHPLDGGKILVGLLPTDAARDVDAILNRYGIFILLLLIFPFGNSQSPVSYLITPIADGIIKFLIG